MFNSKLRKVKIFLIIIALYCESNSCKIVKIRFKKLINRLHDDA